MVVIKTPGPYFSEATMSTIIYTKPACVQCTATKREFDKLGLDYDLVDITADRNARDVVLGLGYLSAPVVMSAGEHWSGFRPDRIKALVNQAA
jgi:glutaredoxin-like protein NrdH